MEFISSLLCLSVIFGYVTGNIAIIIIITSKIKAKSKAARYTLKIIGAILSLILVNLPSLLYAQAAFYIVAEGKEMKFDIVSVILLFWTIAVVLTGWVGFLRDWYLRCKNGPKQG
ncbi:MAG: hypothetical protein D3910_00850 [Candidatus Electrothrix sp. ATG2]|nr:hypothetical protein [Candidatus Electrothrix sp. ATG2]